MSGLILIGVAPTRILVILGYVLFAATWFSGGVLIASSWVDVIHPQQLAVGGAVINTLWQVGAFFAIWLWSGEGCNRRLHAGPNWLGARGRRTSAANPLCSCAGRFRAPSPRAHCCSACSAYGMIKVKGRGAVSAPGELPPARRHTRPAKSHHSTPSHNVFKAAVPDLDLVPIVGFNGQCHNIRDTKKSMNPHRSARS